MNDDDDIDVCTACGRYYGWASVRDLAQANPQMRPFPQQCRRCLGLDAREPTPTQHRRAR